MKKIYFMALMTVYAAISIAQESSAQEPSAQVLPLEEQMKSLDTWVFDAFNHCAAQESLDKHASYFAADVEFYHDNGGVTWDRDAMIANTQKYACGHYTRELIPGTFKAHPIKDFGAITEGVHRFCQSDTKSCDGKAEFVMVWRHAHDKWEITRVLSYGHGANTPEPQDK
ncbi:nuclear transport factor 2 family protein [Shewanella sp. AS16]|uniref:nuclear transport factor 2 family protein n=1 Tax=Shewanella sp. AS16 TaxID=2907625 RepID=UPI001F29D23C|nr:nuclear transport factor 2 family protein [Shewanella sp. AS16]MCE9685708.1 nuclear transport factor 2 family protein [Shewanella sp. AS16]